MILYFLTFGLLLAATNAGVVKTNSLTPRIINGRKALPGELPYQVSLQTTYGFHFCGGSILNENYVITAAHCVVSQTPSIMKIIAGTLNLYEPQETYYVERIIYHKLYNSHDSWKNDIALIKVKTPFKMSTRIQKILLPKSNMDIPVNEKAVVSGWGNIWLGGPSSKDLQLVDIFIADQELCRKMYKPDGYGIHDSQICAYDKSIKKGACHGDSGGPLTVNGVLVGLVSWSHGCAQTKYASVYTRVPKFLDWIAENAI